MKLSCRPRAGNILSTRQPTCVEKVQGEEYPAQPPSRRDRDMKSKTGGVVASTPSARKSTSVTLTKPQEQVKVECDIITNVRKIKSNHYHRILCVCFCHLLWVVTCIFVLYPKGTFRQTWPQQSPRFPQSQWEKRPATEEWESAWCKERSTWNSRAEGFYEEQCGGSHRWATPAHPQYCRDYLQWPRPIRGPQDQG